MDEQGIESLEDLYRRSLATCAGKRNPIVDDETWETPGREAGPMSFTEFCETAIGARDDIGRTFIVGLAEVFGLKGDARLELCRSFIFGGLWDPFRDVHPKTPLPECASR